MLKLTKIIDLIIIIIIVYLAVQVLYNSIEIELIHNYDINEELLLSSSVLIEFRPFDVELINNIWNMFKSNLWVFIAIAVIELLIKIIT